MYEFIESASKHYEAKLEEEKKHFGVRGITEVFVPRNIDGVICTISDMWSAFGNVGLRLQVGSNDSQSMFAILTERDVIRPQQLVQLAEIVEEFRSLDLREENREGYEEFLEILDAYDGPYKREVPKYLLS